MKRFFAATFSLTFFLFASSIVNAAIEVHGHRGARARLPENTLPAFEYALQLGVDVIELDMSVTKDKHIVISHDPHINKDLCLNFDGSPLANSPLIYSLTLAEVKKFDCGSLKNIRFPKQEPRPKTPIPSLEEVFEWIKKSPLPQAKTIRFNLETKILEENPDDTVAPKEFVDLFLKTVRKYQMEDRVILQSFDFRSLQELAKSGSQIPRAALTNKKLGNSVDIFKNTRSQILSPLHYFVNPSYVQRLHDVGAKVIPWTANTESEWHRLLKSEVDGIITDDPEALIQYLKKRGLR
jgi:glycerophosphoryl diester phosphodiesterase